MFRVLSFPYDFIRDWNIVRVFMLSTCPSSRKSHSVSLLISSYWSLVARIRSTWPISIVFFQIVLRSNWLIAVTVKEFVSSFEETKMYNQLFLVHFLTSLKTAKRRKSNHSYPSSMQPSWRRFGDKYRFVGLEDCECDEKKSGKVVCASRWIYVDNLSDDVQKKSEIVSEAGMMAEVSSYFPY